MNDKDKRQLLNKLYDFVEAVEENFECVEGDKPRDDFIICESFYCIACRGRELSDFIINLLYP